MREGGTTQKGRENKNWDGLDNRSCVQIWDLICHLFKQDALQLSLSSVRDSSLLPLSLENPEEDGFGRKIKNFLGMW